MKAVTDAFYKTVVEFSEFTAKFASHFGVEPLVATGVVEGIAELASNKKRRRQDVCNCTHDVCHNSKCKCKAAGRACTSGCSCWQRMGANGQHVCANRGAPAQRSSASSSYEGESSYPHPHSSIEFSSKIQFYSFHNQLQLILPNSLCSSWDWGFRSRKPSRLFPCDTPSLCLRI